MMTDANAILTQLSARQKEAHQMQRLSPDAMSKLSGMSRFMVCQI